jgi:hypothetical protein
MTQYTKPELEKIIFANNDILTDSDELPIVPAQAGEESDGFDAPKDGGGSA